MEALNNDCHLTIIKYLTLYDQLSLLEATKEVPSSRLNSNVRYFWQRIAFFDLDADFFLFCEENPGLLDDFLSTICQTVQAFRLTFITLDNLKRLLRYTFPMLRSLKYTLDDADAELNGNLVAQLIAKLVPHLRSLKPDGTFECAHFTSMSLLRKLDLSETWEATCNPNDIEKFEMLEKLTIPFDILTEEFCQTLMQMPKFQTLTYHFSCAHRELLTELRVKDVHHVVFNDSIWAFELSTLKSLENLRTLTLLEDEGFTPAQLHELVTSLKKLERVDLVDFAIWRSETELWQMVAGSPSLKILHLAAMPLYENFFETNRHAMNKALEKRATPLNLHCYGSGAYEHLIRSCFIHPNLKVSFDAMFVDYIDNNCVRVNLWPLDKLASGEIVP